MCPSALLFTALVPILPYKFVTKIIRLPLYDDVAKKILGHIGWVAALTFSHFIVTGRKFDLRIYVLVTSFRPLKVWLAREGFARLSSELFSLERIYDSRVHLTNMSIQLKVEAPRRQTSVDENGAEDSSGIASSDDASPPKRGRKWSLISVREFLTARHGSPTVERLFQRVAGESKSSQPARNSVVECGRAISQFQLYFSSFLFCPGQCRSMSASQSVSQSACRNLR